MTPFVGTAGWSIPKGARARFDDFGTHLQRYAQVLNAVEINSSFYRPHRLSTYERWAQSTPDHFKFSVKIPRQITHERGLRRSRLLLRQFLDQVRGLGERLGPLLVQLPPSFQFHSRVVDEFFCAFRSRFAGAIVCEPRHATWSTAEATALLERYQVARAAADPPRAAGLETPGGWSGLIYYRLHGSPRIYWSKYEDEYLAMLVHDIESAEPASEVWCIFDNTAAGAACENAVEVRRQLGFTDASPPLERAVHCL